MKTRPGKYRHLEPSTRRRPLDEAPHVSQSEHGGRLKRPLDTRLKRQLGGPLPAVPNPSTSSVPVVRLAAPQASLPEPPIQQQDNPFADALTGLKAADTIGKIFNKKPSNDTFRRGGRIRKRNTRR